MDDRTRTRRRSAARRARAAALCVVAGSLAMVAAGPLAAEPPVHSFSTESSGEPEVIEFTISDRDRTRIDLARRAGIYRHQAGIYRTLAQVDAARLARLRGLLTSSTASTIRVEREDWFLAYGSVGREDLARALLDGELHQLAELERKLARDAEPQPGDGMTVPDEEDATPRRRRPGPGEGMMEMTPAAVSDLVTALEELRDLHAELSDRADRRARMLLDRADRMARADRRGKAAEGTREDAGLEGTWYVAPSDRVARQRYLPLGSGPFGPFSWSGTRTPARPSTDEQIRAVLLDSRITIYEGGRFDVAGGRIDGRILDALVLLAERYGQVTVTSLISGRSSIYTAGGNVSAHAFGCAVDIGTVGGVLIAPASQGPGSHTEGVVSFLATLPGDLAPHQVISLSALGGPTIAMADHHDHIHLGYSCG